MLEVNNNTKRARKITGGLVIAAAIVVTAGMHQQRKQQDATVDWHQVSTALMDVEGAKRELHESLQERISRE